MRRLRLIGVAVALAVLVLLVVSPLASSASGGSRNTKYQWDIINFDFATSTITAGGHASAFATGSGGSIHTGKITVTGHGTFRSNPGNPQDVTGGGTWQTFDGTGSPSGSGRYQVTGFVDFHVAPGSLPDSVTDNSGIKADVRSGLAVFQIAYDDGSAGVSHRQLRSSGRITEYPVRGDHGIEGVRGLLGTRSGGRRCEREPHQLP
jgi:hypothetical protein